MTKVQTTEEFFEDFKREVENAKERIYIQTMNFEIGPRLLPLAQVLVKKAKEGVDVRITMDWVYKRYVGDDLRLLPLFNREKRKYKERVHTENERVIQELKDAGAHIEVVNKAYFLPFLVPIIGRNHKKIYIVDTKAAWLGGINFFDGSFYAVDFMVKFQDDSIIKKLVQEYFKIERHKHREDVSVVLNSDMNLLLDSGKRGSSIIYQEAIDMVRRAKETIQFVSQLPPDGKLLEAIVGAVEKGIKVELYTSKETSRQFNDFPYNTLYLHFQNRAKQYPGLRLNHLLDRLHAKLLIVDNKEALFGSHNLVHLGVMLGTEEIAIKTKNVSLLTELSEFITKELRSS
ncbi:MAG: phosphatidylserine/phosphatidylglycerophosphate/cardiolipin synthase family protein [bacterium]|nr:phosphatidylserine/phosphatidylglycerophosphate/cardiolipin synthase family protein [bacterium]